MFSSGTDPAAELPAQKLAPMGGSDCGVPDRGSDQIVAELKKNRFWSLGPLGDTQSQFWRLGPPQDASSTCFGMSWMTGDNYTLSFEENNIVQHCLAQLGSRFSEKMIADH